MSIHLTEEDYWAEKEKGKTKTWLLIIFIILIPILGMLL